MSAIPNIPPRTAIENVLYSRSESTTGDTFGTDIIRRHICTQAAGQGTPGRTKGSRSICDQQDTSYVAVRSPCPLYVPRSNGFGGPTPCEASWLPLTHTSWAVRTFSRVSACRLPKGISVRVPCFQPSHGDLGLSVARTCSTGIVVRALQGCTGVFSHDDVHASPKCGRHRSCDLRQNQG